MYKQAIISFGYGTYTMNDEKTAIDFAKSLSTKINIFRPFDDTFEPLLEQDKATMFKHNREGKWPVIKKALLVMSKLGQIMLFYRSPKSNKKEEFFKAQDTYGLMSYNSITIYDTIDISFSELAKKNIEGWQSSTHIINVGMSYSLINDHMYFFEVGYAVVPENTAIFVNGVKGSFVDLKNAVEIMRSHGLEYKEMEINIAKSLCKVR